MPTARILMSPTESLMMDSNVCLKSSTVPTISDQIKLQLVSLARVVSTDTIGA